jgi:hypothetical protein
LATHATLVMSPEFLRLGITAVIDLAIEERPEP